MWIALDRFFFLAVFTKMNTRNKALINLELFKFFAQTWCRSALSGQCESGHLMPPSLQFIYKKPLRQLSTTPRHHCCYPGIFWNPVSLRQGALIRCHGNSGAPLTAECLCGLVYNEDLRTYSMFSLTVRLETDALCSCHECIRSMKETVVSRRPQAWDKC